MKFNLEFVIGMIYIAIITGMTMGSVGKMSGPPEIYQWWLPVIMHIMLLCPFILGYYAGKSK